MKLYQIISLLASTATISATLTCTALNEKCGVDINPCCSFTFCDDFAKKCVPTPSSR